MKCCSFLLLLVFASLSAQKPEGGEILITKHADYKPAELTFVDGHKEQGFIYGFISNKFIAFGSLLETGFETLENDLNLMDDSFTFKTTMDGEKKKLGQKEVIEVKLFWNTDTPKFYRLMDMKTATGDGEVIDLKKKVWLPLYYTEGKINVFSFDTYSVPPNALIGKNKAIYNETFVYLNHSDDNFAINARDVNRMNLFNIDKIDDKFVTTLKYIFKDCPEFIQTFSAEPMDVYLHYYDGLLWRETNKKLKEYKKQHKELTKDQIDQYAIDYRREAEILPYMRCIKEYHQKCPN
jgi:hypothetical protein